MQVKIHLETCTSARMPEYADSGCSGADVFASIPHPTDIEPRVRATVSTGIRLEIPDGYEVQIRPKSGLAAKHGITVLNTPGTIDSSYRGELKVLLVNLSNRVFTLEPGMKIAQLVMAKVERISFIKVEGTDELTSTDRGEGGFGSSGQ